MRDFITNKELKNNSTLQSYIDAAKTELDLQNTIINNSKLESLRTLTESIDEKNNILLSNFEELYKERNNLYENLISIIIYKRYLSIIKNNTENYKNQLENLNLLNNKSILNNINELTSIISLASNSSALESTTVLSNKLNDYKNFFRDLFEKEKLLLGYDNITISNNGSLEGLNNVYNVNSLDGFSGTLSFSNNDLKGSFEEKIRNLDTETNVTLELKNTKDIIVENGTEDSPYVIDSINDERLGNSDYYQKSTILTLNNTISLNIPKKQTKAIGNIFTTIKGNNNEFKINVKKEKTILNFFAKYENTRFIISGTGEIEVNIGNFDANILEGIIFNDDNTIEIESETKYGAKFYFDGFTTVNIYFKSGSEKLKESVATDENLIKILKRSFFITGSPKRDTNNILGNLLDLVLPSSTTLVFDSKSEEITGSTLPIHGIEITDKTNDNTSYIINKVKNPIIEANTGTFKIVGTKNANSIDDNNNGKIYFNDNGKILSFYFINYINNNNEETAIEHSIDCSNAIFSLIGDNNNNNLNDDNNEYNNSDLNILSSLAKLSNLNISDTDSLSSVLASITTLKNALNNKKKSLSNFLSSAANNINKSYTSVDQILALRNANDSNYNYDYIENIQNKMTESNSYLSTLLQTETDQINTELYFEKMVNTNNDIENECDNLLIGIIDSIINLNKTIENYSELFTISVDYKKAFREIINTTYEAIISVSENECYQPYGSIRSFDEKWETTILKYTDAGIFDIGPIYISYELGSNLFKINLYRLVNDRLISIFKKSLFKNPYKTDVFNYEKELYTNYKIKIKENPGYEILPPVLTDEISELTILNNIDIVECMHSLNNNKMKKLLETVEMIIAKYLSINNENFLIKVELIQNILTHTENNFKTLIVKYAFQGLIKKLKEKINGFNPTIDNIEYEKIISKYISVWNLKYYSFSDSESSLLILGGNELSKFVSYKINNTVALEEDEKIKIAESTLNSIKNSWNGLINIWNEIKK